jgi:RHS repeat-associated protein
MVYARLKAFCSLVLSFLFVGLGTFSAPAIAVDAPSFDPKPVPELDPLRSLVDQTSQLGEIYDPYSGDLGFSQTDISIPGTGLPIIISRSYRVSEYKFRGWNFQDPNPLVPSDFWNWNLELPHISVALVRSQLTMGVPTLSVGYPATACSQGLPVAPTIPGTSAGDGRDYSGGYYLTIPKQEPQLIFSRGPNSTAAGSAPLLTKENWQISCLSGAISPSGSSVGEGFLAVSPQGIKYSLDRLLIRSGFNIVSLVNNNAGGMYFVSRYMMAVSRIEDVNGNTLDYTYNSSGRLIKITASDGRVVNFYYNTDLSISSIESGGRIWNYNYEPYVYGSGLYSNYNRSLARVTRPDGLEWRFNLKDLDIPAIIPGAPGNSGSITTPYGMVATYRTNGINHAAACSYTKPLGAPAGTGRVFYGPTLIQKQYQHPLIGTYVWTYDYQSSWTYDTATDQVTSITNPDATKNVYAIYASQCSNLSGSTKTLSVLDAAGNTVRKTTNTYLEGTVLGYAPASGSFASTAIPSHPVPQIGKQVNLTKRVIIQDGSTYTTDYSGYDVFGFPSTVQESNTLTQDSKINTYQYSHKLNRWVLGLETSKAIAGVIQDSTTYDDLGRAIDIRKFGLLEKTFGYAANGTISSVKEPANRTTLLSNYYRGQPRTVAFPDSSTISQTLNAFGEQTGFTDGRTNLTTYTRDSVGRLAGISYPGGEGWSPLTITYSLSQAAELDIPAGAWKSVSVNGRMRKTQYYDPLLRPILVEEKDTTANTAIYKRMAYDYEGRLTFESYPSSSYAPVAGVNLTYDALGRLTKRQTTDGLTLEKINYLSGNRKEITDADGKITTISYQAFGEPEYISPILIQSPETQTTTIARDVFGKITSITQSGTWNGSTISAARIFTYDDYQRPCRRTDPESGSTVWGYDADNHLKWELKGQSGSGCLTSQPTGATVFSYDKLGRKTGEDYPDAADDVAYSYDANGNVVGVANTAATWTYGYNKRNLLKSEIAQIDGKTFSSSKAYNSIGGVDSLTTPSRTISYAPDAWGRPTQIGTWATGVQYHPNGLPSAYTLGNNFSYTLTLNARQWPENQKTTGTVGTVQSYAYSYYNSGDLAAIDDQDGGADDVTLTYDGLHRLKTASGLWGSYTYEYDPLNNLRSRAKGALKLSYNYASPSNRLASIYQYTSVSDPGPCADCCPPGVIACPPPAIATASATNVQTASSGGTPLPTISVLRSFAYNVNGEITGDGVRTLTLNGKGQITGIAETSTTYIYDGHGRRIKAIKGSAVEYAIYDLSGKLVYTEDNVAKKDFLNLGNKTIVELSLSGTITSATYLHPDLLGSPRLATDPNQAIKWQEHYDPFGQKLNGVSEKVGYTGHAFDAESGYTYMEARFYDPLVGRFLSIDPVNFSDQNPFTFNRYSYANNNPYRYSDPNGEQSLSNWPVRGWYDLNIADQPREGDGAFGSPRNTASGPSTHSGIDIQAPIGTRVVATADGKVVKVISPSKTYGNQVVIDHGKGLFTQSAHLDSTSVKPGDTVKAGDQIGTVGTTGNTPPKADSHLHFETRIGSSAPRSAGGKVVDPINVLPPRPEPPPPPPPPALDL